MLVLKAIHILFKGEVRFQLANLLQNNEQLWLVLGTEK